MRLAAFLRSYFRLSSGGFPAPTILGSLPDGASLVAALNARDVFAVLNGGGLSFQSSAGATITLTALQSLYQKLTNGGAVTVTLDSAYNIVRTVLSPYLGQVFNFSIFSSGAGTVATPTLSDTAVTLSGTTSIAAGLRRLYQLAITQLVSSVTMALTAGSTFTSIAQVGSTNNFTVTLGTNAIVPTVGQLWGITVTAGTLPSGYYPINKVTSATSFVVALPAGTVWTATAGTLLTANPSAPVYSPLVTITAIEAVAAVV